MQSLELFVRYEVVTGVTTKVAVVCSWMPYGLIAMYSDTSANEDNSLTEIFVSRNIIKSEAAYVIRRLTSRCLERKQPSRVGGSPLCDVVSPFLCHTYRWKN
jgi:hypothetical protein